MRAYWWVLTILLLSSSAHAQVNFLSPGPLAKAHQSIDGRKNCSKCHVAGKGLSTKLCLDCHTEIQTRVVQNKGYHGRMQNIESQCFQCHPDHVGRDFQLIEWKPSKDQFDHNLTGYVLEGAHISQTCDACHMSKLLTDNQIKKTLSQHPNKQTYLGLSTTCQSCHFDEHRNQLSQQCQECHTQNQWKPADQFDHNKTSFALRGKHLQVACQECHPQLQDHQTYKTYLQPAKMTYTKMRPIAHQSCENCHADPHEGSFGKDCQSCHTEKDWKEVIGNKMQDRQFHQKTRYPLLGAHMLVACSDCHGPWGNGKAKYKDLAFQKCTNCHIDAHLGQIKYNTKGTETCEACHTFASFSVVEYTIAQHQTTPYPLENAHIAIACNQCHKSDKNLLKRLPVKSKKMLAYRKRKTLVSTAVFDFKNDLQACETCHTDIHHGQFKKKKCASCHQTTSFLKILFDHNTDSQFPLKKAHENVPCYKCHKIVRTKSGQKMQLFRPLPKNCIACHTDIHYGQFVDKNKNLLPCGTCHNETTWEKDLRFNHNDKAFTDYGLVGKHKSVKCEQCHQPILLKNKEKVILYKPLSRKCFSCHADHHKGEFGDFI
ncbi:MAG: hypothetical protein KDK51_05770 [Deltaproteobacteria bacterium]|nr:hypothetical protein [Deltaproteobacteria bacterium]